jgi:uncharacterized protein YndB with AHSA1/START domain
MTNAATLQISTPSDRELVMTRVFDAPRNLVFDAMTKPELITRWYGPRGWTMLVCEVDETYTKLAELLSSMAAPLSTHSAR